MNTVGAKALTRNNMLNLSFETLIKIGLKSDYEDFEKASNNGKILLKFQKSNTFDIETPFVYVIAAILSKLEENRRIYDFNFSKISIQIKDDAQKKILSYEEIMKQKNKYIANHSGGEQFDEYMQNKFEYYRNYVNALNNLYLFRNSLLF